MRDRRLQRVQAVVQRKQGVLAEGHRHGLLLGHEHGRARGLGPHRHVMEKAPLPPLGDGLAVQAISGGELFERSLRSLYRRSDGVRGRGAAMEYLAHNSSRCAHSAKLSPPHIGTRHLAPGWSISTAHPFAEGPTAPCVWNVTPVSFLDLHCTTIIDRSGAAPET